MNKKILFAPFLVFAAGVLAACSTDTVVSRPDWKDQQIIDGLDVKDNQMKVIYDAVKNLGDTNSNVLNRILYKISKKNIGSYGVSASDKTYDEANNLLDFDGKTLQDVDKEKLKTFINNHPIYKTKETKLIYKDASGVEKEEEIKEGDDNYLQIALNSIQKQIDEIRENIYEKLYDDIKGGSYSVDNVFYEEKFIANLRKNLYDIPSISKIKETTKLNEGQLLPRKNKQDSTTKEWKKESWSTYIKKYLNVETEIDNKKIYDDYINTKIVPDLYRTYLIQTYVKEQRYSNISRSYARKVNMITIAKGDTEMKGKIRDLMTSFADHYITGKTTPNEGYNFEVLEEAMRGFAGTAVKTPDDYSAYDLLANKAKFTVMQDDTPTKTEIIWTSRIDGAKHKVFKGTKLADLVKKYQQIYDITMSGENMTVVEKANPDQTAYNDLTNSGAYTVEEGLLIKEREILNTTYTKEGWYLKNGGLSDLNSDIRERLFNIQTSNLVDTKTPSTYEAGNYVKYINVNGHDRAFLTEKSPSGSGDENLIVLDDNTNLHIIEVQEAISTSKMSDSSNKNSYMHKKATTKDDKFASINAMNDIVYNVVKSASSGDTYKKNANQYYLMISNIIFYDQAVYDYFKSQYPDLFK